MAKKYVDRKTVLNALRIESLTAGEFVENRHDNKKCDVCAVGAVLRGSGLADKDIQLFGWQMLDYAACSVDSYRANTKEGKQEEKKAIRDHLKNKEYLHALSVKFEGQAVRTGTGKRTREILAKFVKEHFPKRVKLDPAL